MPSSLRARPLCTRRSRLRAAIAAATLYSAAACVGRGSVPAAPPAPSDAERPAVAAAETFDSAWTIVARSHWDSTYNGVDWSALRDSLRPRAVTAPSQRALRGVLEQMVGALGQSHFGIIPAEVSDATTGSGSAASEASPADGEVGLTLRWQDDQLLVTHVERGGPADRAGVRIGWALEQVDGDTLTTQLRRLADLPAAADPRRMALFAYRVADEALRGAAGSRAVLRLRDGEGGVQERTVERAPLAGTEVKFGNLPPQRARLTWERRLVEGKRVGVIRFNIWMPVLAREFDVAMDSLRDSDGLVIDIRGNFGGVGGMAMGIAGHLVDSVVPVGVMTTRAQTIKFAINPRRVNTANERVSPYGGPVALVVDALSVSTSEIFAGGLQDLGRVRVFGEQTAGQALPALAERLPNGDILYHAIADFRGPSGRRLEGEGVTPDVLLRPERGALLRGADPALDGALAWAATAPAPGAGTRPRVVP